MILTILQRSKLSPRHIHDKGWHGAELVLPKPDKCKSEDLSEGITKLSLLGLGAEYCLSLLVSWCRNDCIPSIIS